MAYDRANRGDATESHISHGVTHSHIIVNSSKLYFALHRYGIAHCAKFSREAQEGSCRECTSQSRVVVGGSK